MKITKFETFHIKPRWLFLEITTDEGIVGFGEPVIEGKSKAVEAAVHSFGEVLIGQNPCDIEHLWQLMYRGSFYRGGPIMMSAISGIEQALWDIKGKFYNMPVYEMLGGKVRDRIKMYPHLSGMYPDDGDCSTEKWIRCAKTRQQQGFSMIKVCLDGPMDFMESKEKVDEFVDKMNKVREAVGNKMDIAIDFHGRVSPSLAIRLCKKLEPMFPMFVEEPVLPENIDAMVKVKQATTIPIAAGERLFSKWGFKDLIEKDAVSIVQPDACHAGGIFEIRKIAAMAETHHCAIAPHNPLGPISLAACLQIDACTPNFLAQEHPGMDNGWDRGVGILKKPFEVVDGYIEVPKGHGLGIEVDKQALLDKTYDGDWQTPVFYDEYDLSVRDW